MLHDLAKPYFEGWFKSLPAQTRPEVTRKVYQTQLAGVTALRMEVRYFRGDQYDSRQGCGLFFFGRLNAFFIVVTGDAPTYHEAGDILRTFVIEPGR
jgi:hypothetical protein